MEKSNVIKHWLSEDGHILDIYSGSLDENTKDKISRIIDVDVESILFSILVREGKSLESYEIPIFSNFNDCTINMCLALDTINNVGIVMHDLGKLLLEYDAKKMAYYKYGESHSKTASLLGLTKIVYEDNITKVYLTNLGYFYILEKAKREKMITRLLLRTNIIQEILRNYYSESKKINVNKCLSSLSLTTQIRRMSNVKKMFEELSKSDEFDFESIYRELNFNCKEV